MRLNVVSIKRKIIMTHMINIDRSRATMVEVWMLQITLEFYIEINSLNCANILTHLFQIDISSKVYNVSFC